ncbi:hypothetical protein MVEN_00491500 [Mycena venus]|uniref:Uncharacterized protein n=1 Tax=Mycena venus TaxID=2733690 RepID=A0A8H7DC24_9AGAR|nr:hypothetical protein MVEN_00491500 [Mycena venus]
MVDFYMSCRGKEKTYPLKGRARRATFLDEEFRRVRDEWMRAGRELKGAIFSGENQKAEPSGMMLDQAPTDPQPPPRLPPMSAQYAREKHDENREGGPTKPPFPRSISDPLPLPSSSPRPLGTRGSKESLPSVMSLPLLGMIRGVPVSHRLPLWVANPGDTMSVSSSNETRNSKLMKSSPLRDGIASAAQDSTNMQPTHIGHAVLGTSILSSSRSGSSRREKSKISRKGTAPQVKDDAKIFVVPLGHKDKDDDATWHGLERRFSSMRSARGTSRHDSPWLGPLTDLNEAIIYTPDYSEFSSDDDWDDDSDSDSDDDAAWPLDGTGVMGYLTPKVAVLSDMPLPYGSYTPLPAMSSSSPYTGAEPYTMPYVSPQVQHSPYQPLSRPRTPLTYGTTPPIQLPRSSPGTVYTPTAHTSHARYSGPYLSESPAAGHATSPYAAASPAAGYTNIAQNYSSPYVQGHGYNN